MRTLVILFASSTTILGAVCAYLLWRAGGAPARPGAADEGVTETRIETLIAERERLRREVERGRSERPCDEPAGAVTSGGSARPEGGAAGSPALARIGSGPGGLLERLAPEHRRTLTRQHYGMIFHELALSDADIDALLPILASLDERTPTGFARSAPADPLEAQAREQAIASVLGAEKAAQFTAVHRRMPARMEARMLLMQLEHAGTPLSDEQHRQLIAAMKDLAPAEPPMTPGASPQESMERFRAWRAERSKAVRELAAPVLTPRQLQRLDESEALETAVQAAIPAPAVSF